MADKKLLEESVIARFQQLANINGGSKTVLTESTEVAGGRAAFPTNGSSGTVTTAGQTGPIREKKHKPKDGHQKDLEEKMDEELEEGMDEELEEGQYEESLEEADEEGGMDLGGMEGGESGAREAMENFVQSLNTLISSLSEKVPELGDMEVAAEPTDGGEAEEEPEMDMGGEEGSEMGSEDEEEPLAESIELVDEELVEKLLQRVSARLVAEARKSRELAEGKKGGKGWGTSGMHKTTKKPTGHGAKPTAPFKGAAKGAKGKAGHK